MRTAGIVIVMLWLVQAVAAAAPANVNLLPSVLNWDIQNGTATLDNGRVFIEHTDNQQPVILSYNVGDVMSADGVDFRLIVGNHSADTSNLIFRVYDADNTNARSCTPVLEAGATAGEYSLQGTLQAGYTDPVFEIQLSAGDGLIYIESVFAVQGYGFTANLLCLNPPPAYLSEGFYRYDNIAFDYTTRTDSAQWQVQLLSGNADQPYVRVTGGNTLNFAFTGSAISIQLAEYISPANGRICVDARCIDLNQQSPAYGTGNPNYEYMLHWTGLSDAYSHRVLVTTLGGRYGFVGAEFTGAYFPEQQGAGSDGGSPDTTDYSTVTVNGETVSVAYDYTVTPEGVLIAVFGTAMLFFKVWGIFIQMRGITIQRRKTP